jgi:hypothetical protein
VDGSDRIVIIWPDNAIRNQWLQVVVRPTPNTGLAESDRFIFGNLVGETGDSDTTFRVNALDLAGVKRALNTPAPITSRFDFNRDGRINALDVAALKQNLNKVLSINMGTPPAVAAASPFFGGPIADVSAESTVRRVWDEAAPGLL